MINQQHVAALKAWAMERNHDPKYFADLMNEPPAIDPDHTYMIWNMVTGECTTEALTPQSIEKLHTTWLKPRDAHEVVVMFPRALGINIYNSKSMPVATMFEGMERWNKFKRGEFAVTVLE